MDSKSIIKDIYGDVTLYPKLLDEQTSNRLFNWCLHNICWAVEGNRQVSYYGVAPYKYSNTTHVSSATGCINFEYLLLTINNALSTEFNSVLCNLYSNERSSLGWHADDEQCLGLAPVIASLSLNATRTFSMKSKNNTRFFDISLRGGSMLVMQGNTQKYFLHCLPKCETTCGQRINLTFRRIIV